MHDKGFPTLYFPKTVRRALAYETPKQIPQSVHELPIRLPMGDLQPDTFNKTAGGFEVFYRSGDFSLKLDIKGDSAYFMERYKGTELLYYIGVATKFLGPMMGHLRIGPSEEADKQMGADLSEIGNIKYVPFGNVMETGTANFFPDGFLMSIVIPLRIDGLVFQRLSKFFRNMPNDNSVALNGFIEFAHHVVNYRQGLCSDVPNDPMMLYLWSLERGYLPIAMPELEGRPGNQALTVRRMGYNLVLNVFMRDIFKVALRLKDAGLINSNQDSNQEETTIVTDMYKLKSGKDLSFYTNDQSRRVFYNELMGDEIDMNSPPLGYDEFDSRLDSILSNHTSIVREFKARLDKMMTEAESNGR